MRTWLRRARGLAGLGVVGAVVGGGLGGLVTAIASFRAYGTVPGFGLMVAVLIGAVFGGATTSAFGLLLAATARGRSIEELSMGRAALMAGAVSAFIAVTVSALARGGAGPVGVVLSQVLIFGGFGATLGGGLLTMAKRASRRVPGSPDRPSAIEP